MDAKCKVFSILLASALTMVSGTEDDKTSGGLPDAVLALAKVLPTKQEIKGFLISFLQDWVTLALEDGELGGLQKVEVVGEPERGKYSPTGEDAMTYVITFPELIVQYKTLEVLRLEGFWAASLVKNKVKLVIHSGGGGLSGHRILEVTVEQLEGFDLAEHCHFLGSHLVMKLISEQIKERYTHLIQQEVSSKLVDLIKKLYETKFVAQPSKDQKDQARPPQKKFQTGIVQGNKRKVTFNV